MTSKTNLKPLMYAAAGVALVALSVHLFGKRKKSDNGNDTTGKKSDHDNHTKRKKSDHDNDTKRKKLDHDNDSKNNRKHKSGHEHEKKGKNSFYTHIRES